MFESRWRVSPAYQEDRADDFVAAVNQIADEKGDELKHTDIAHLDVNHPGGHQGIDKFLVDYPLQPGASVFEVGCGYGGTSRHVASKCDVNIFGIDYLSHCAEASQLANHKLGMTQIHHTQGNITTIDLPENTYDCAISITVFMHILETEGYSNIFKTLKPGGLFYFEDYYFVRDRSTFTEEEAKLTETRVMDGVHTREARTQTFTSAGFEIVEDSEFGQSWSEYAWDRAERLLKAHNEGTVVLEPIQYRQFVETSPYLTCDLEHYTLEELKSRYPNLDKILDIDYIVFRKPRLTKAHRVIARKPR